MLILTSVTTERWDLISFMVEMMLNSKMVIWCRYLKCFWDASKGPVERNNKIVRQQLRCPPTRIFAHDHTTLLGQECICCKPSVISGRTFHAYIQSWSSYVIVDWWFDVIYLRIWKWLFIFELALHYESTCPSIQSKWGVGVSCWVIDRPTDWLTDWLTD